VKAVTKDWEEWRKANAPNAPKRKTKSAAA
jgi:hypothetical protein